MERRREREKEAKKGREREGEIRSRIYTISEGLRVTFIPAAAAVVTADRSAPDQH